MNPLFRIPIRLQLIIIVLIVAIPAAVIIGYSGVQHKIRAINHARIDTQNLVDMVATEQRLFVASAQQLLIKLSQLPEITQRDTERSSFFLARIQRLHPSFVDLFVADSNGTVWASATPFLRPVSISDRRYFKDAIATGGLASGEFQIGRLSGRPTLNFGYPYRDRSGNIEGIIGLGVALQSYRTLLTLSQIPERTQMVLLDYKGIVLYSSTGQMQVGQPFNAHLFKKMKEGPEAATSTATGIVGDSPRLERYVSYRKMYLKGETIPYMYIWVGIPVESALAEANQQIVRSMVTFALVLASVLFLAWLVGEKSIADRIKTLQRAAESVAGGNLEVRVSELVRGGELGSLGATFDAMAQELTLREERLSNSQRFLNTIIDTEPECLMMLEPDRRISMMNRAGLKLFEADSLEQLRGTDILPFITPPGREPFLKLMDDVLHGIPGNLKFEAVGLQGRHIWLEIHAVSFCNESGEIVSFLGIARDVTDRHLGEQVLLQREADLRKAQRLAKLGSWTYDLVTGRIFWSDEVYRIYGISRATFTPTIDSFLSIIHPEDQEAMRAWVEACVAGRQPGELEFRVVLPDGSIRFISGRGELVEKGEGERYLSGTAQDVTDRKRTDEQLREKQHQLEELNRNLEKRVAEAVADLRRKDQMLIQQSRLAAMGEMIGNIAHQWRQPLNTVGLIIQELRLTFGHEEFSKESLDANVKKAMSLIQHMSKTIDGFISYFRPDNQEALFNVNNAVATTLSLIESSFHNQNIDIELVEEGQVDVRGFSNEYSQVLLNILFNARDAFLLDRDSERKKVVRIGVSREGAKSVVTIADNAGGIPEDVMTKIFDPYFTTKGPDKGTGIGLYMSKMIIEEHMRGKLTVRNVPGGAEFRVEV
jgi:two-component system, cell cycle sensor histidine kinase and response regulator CckA